MSNRDLITDAHALANEQLQRLTVLLLLLPNERENLPVCQQKEIDAWMFEIVVKAQASIKAASDAMVGPQDDVASGFATALDAAQTALDGGMREQQKVCAAEIRGILSLRGYPVREAL